MKRLKMLIAIAAGATSIVALAAVGSTAAAAAPNDTGYARDTVCVVHQPNNTWTSCLDVIVHGSISAGRT